MQPDIRYAKSSGAAIAYQVVGKADTDLMFVPDNALIHAVAQCSPRVAGNPAYPMNQPTLGLFLQELESTAGSAKPALGQAFSLPLGGSRTKVQCDGNGTSGERVTILDVRVFDTPDSYAVDKPPLDVWRLC
jgi:hypothetical protein